MGSSQDWPEDTVTLEFDVVAVSSRKRINKHGGTYTNLRCGKCTNWWIMIAIGEKKKVHCPWCGTKQKVKL